MRVHCSYRFYEQLQELSKNNSYSAILTDICDYFKDKSVGELHITKDIIQSSSKTYSLNKYRIINSKSNKGKSSSYRCIRGCFVKDNVIILDTIYPKTGSEGIDNLSKETYKEIAKNIKQAIEQNLLYTLNLDTQIFHRIR